MGLGEWLQTSIAKNGDTVFLESGSLRLTYRDVLSAATERLSAIKAAGDGPVVVDAGLGIEFFEWAIAAFMGRRVLVPHLASKISIDAVSEQLPDFTHIASGVLSRRPGSGTPFRDSDVYCLFTSGTTGTPKAVVVNTGNVFAYVDGIGDVVGTLGRNLRSSCLFSPVFDLFFHDLLVAIQKAWTLVIPSGLERVDLSRFVNNRHLDVWFSTPTHAANCISRVSGQISYSFFCGEALSTNLAAAWHRDTRGLMLVNLYGPTETTIAVTAATFDLNDDLASAGKTVPIGVPFGANGVDIHQANGELIVVGPQLARYKSDSQLSGFRTLADGRRAYATGDKVMTVDGQLVHLSRLDRQVKLNGNRIELAELELFACSIIGVLQARAEPEFLDGRCVGFALFVLGNADGPTLRRAFSERYAGRFIPTEVRRVDSFEQNAAGKAISSGRSSVQAPTSTSFPSGT